VSRRANDGGCWKRPAAQICSNRRTAGLAIPIEARHRQGPNDDLVLLEAPLKFDPVAALPVGVQFIGHNFSDNDGVFFHHVTVFPTGLLQGRYGIR
jgi:hypothetical protein